MGASAVESHQSDSGLEHKAYNEKLRAGTVECGEWKTQSECDSSLWSSNWDSIKKRGRFFSEVS